MKPILSISLLCSGRKDTTKKCLDSLKKIMDQVESELIIVDTGCDEATRELLEEYTDHIVPFTWCNDFGAARNAGLQEAKGEWFLYIDDDEWFEEVGEIVDFFRTGEYKKYGQACYIQRNYRDFEGVHFQDMWVSRMIKLRSDTHFIDRIHEYLHPIHGQNKLLYCWANHYGYIYHNAEDKKKHDERNVSIMKEILIKQPGHLRVRAHLAQEYMGVPNHKEMRELCLGGIDQLRKKDDELSNSYRQTFYLGALLAKECLDDKDSLEFFEEAVKDKRNDSLGRAGLCQLASELYYKKKDYEACDKCCEYYIKVYNKEAGAQGELRKLPMSPIFTQHIFYTQNRNNLFCIYIANKLAQDDTSVLKEYFWKLGWDEANFSIHESMVIEAVAAMARLPYEEEFVEIVRKMLQQEQIRDFTIDTAKKVAEKSEAALYALAKIFGQMDSPHYYIWYMKLFYAADEHREADVKEAFCQLFKKVLDALALDDKVFAVADEYVLDMEEVIAGVAFDQWKQCVDSLCEKNPMDVVWKREAFMERRCQGEGSRYGYFKWKVSEVETVVTVEATDYKMIRDRMKQFSDTTYSFYGNYYLPEAFEGEMEMLPPSARVGACLRRVLQAEEAGDIALFRQELTAAIGIFRPLDEGLKKFGKLYAAYREEQLKESQQVSDEMRMLARQVKQQLYRFILKGDKQTAYGILQQLKALTPDDPELAQLEAQCKE
ncbi:MAG: glycosyltransferase [Candidatus Gastranaerophilales bacterium]|nr:glycosyltransferase [Candidatus Gastranaerophilales bacterium]